MRGRIGALAAAAFAVLGLAACGSSGGGSGGAQSLLRQTFSSSHTVNSGNLTLTLSVSPTGSSTLRGPIVLSFGGPFQSVGKGKLPKSDFNVSISALGHTGTLGILSTGTAGYVTMQGTSYQLPAATFQRLESSFASLAGSPGGSGPGALGKLGINPMHWLTNPTVTGTDTVAGAGTTRIRAGINMAALLADLNTFLSKASTIGVAGTSSLSHGLSQSTQNAIIAKVKNPTVDVWTGNSDKTLRKLQVNLTVPVTGTLASVFGPSAGIAFTMQYANLNQPQNIVAPTKLAPYSQFTTKINAILQAITSAVGSALGTPTGIGGGSTGSGSSGSGSSGAGASGSSSGNATTKYGQCILQANGDVARMQSCASLIGQ
jgi:hypothetical protein